MSPSWVEVPVAALLVASGLLAVTGALGILRLRDSFQRMHAPALASTLGAWCAAIASVVHFSALEGQPVLYPLTINLLMLITAPVTTVLLARAALFRKRAAGAAVPPPLRVQAMQSGDNGSST